MNVLSMFRGDSLAYTDHAQLTKAKAAREAAAQRLEDARATYARYQNVSHMGNVASRAATGAVRAAADGRQSWVKAACPFAGMREVQILDDAAAVAVAAAQRASADATAVMRELSNADHAVALAQSELEECDNKIRFAIDMIFVDEMAPTFERRAQLIAELQSCEVAIRGLEDFVGSCEAEARIRSARGSAALKAIPQFQTTPSGSLVSRPPDEVLGLTQTWRERAARLRENPNG